jgi:SAM-dependent methyltransferase
MERTASLRGADDFGSLDFDRLWRGRSKTTAVEATALRAALARTDPARRLEVGPGHGRLSPVVRSGAVEYVASDVTRDFARRLDGAGPDPERNLRVAANVYRLPFVDHSFTAIVMVRVYNFLAEPRAALRELARVLRPGGHLVLSYEPRPSLGTLAGDLRVSLQPHPRPVPSQTFSRAERVPVHPSSFPAWAATRASTRRTLEAAGLGVELELGTGLEDFRPFKWLPTGVFPPLGSAFGGTVDGMFPSRFVLARAIGDRRPSLPLPPLGESLACPSCARPLGARDLQAAWTWTCPTCGFEVHLEGGFLDAIRTGEGPRP